MLITLTFIENLDGFRLADALDGHQVFLRVVGHALHCAVALLPELLDVGGIDAVLLQGHEVNEKI